MEQAGVTHTGQRPQGLGTSPDTAPGVELPWRGPRASDKAIREWEAKAAARAVSGPRCCGTVWVPPYMVEASLGFKEAMATAVPEVQYALRRKASVTGAEDVGRRRSRRSHASRS